MGNHVSLDWSDKDSEQCLVYDGPIDQNQPIVARQPILRQLISLRVPLHHAEVVCQLKQELSVEKSSNVKELRGKATADTRTTLSGPNQEAELDLSKLRKRVWKIMVVTPGAVVLGATARTGAKKMLGTASSSNVSSRWIVLPLHKIRKVVVVDATKNLVWIYASLNDDVATNALLYQTPRFATPPWVEAWVKAHVGFPPWAVTCRFVGFPAAAMQNQLTMPTDISLDGGLSYCWQARLWSRILILRKTGKLKPTKSSTQGGALNVREIVLMLLREQQSVEDPLRKLHYQRIDVVRLVRDTILNLDFGVKESIPGEVIRFLEQDVLECLSFNLIFRSITTKLQNSGESNGSALIPMARLLLYNVTLRSLNLSGSCLQDGGMLGDALAHNAQPLLSTLVLDQCMLRQEDLEGWIPGLVRTWGSGGSSHPVKFSARDNPEVPVQSWDRLWRELMALPPVSGQPLAPAAPAPVLNFWQQLNLRGTTAAEGVGLSRLVRQLKGLKRLEWDHSGLDRGQLLQALADTPAPLEYLLGCKLQQVDYAVFPHSKTLRYLVLPDWAGDAASLVNRWPIPVPKLELLFTGRLDRATCHGSTLRDNALKGYCPGTLSVQHRGLASQVLKCLSFSSTGLHTLELSGVEYTMLVDNGTIACLSVGSLRKLVLGQPPRVRGCDCARKKEFWATLAPSKTLEYLDVTDQFSHCEMCHNEHEVALVGQFLRVNRSLRYLFLDSVNIRLDPEDVKVLRSAFFGNGKLLHISYPKKAQETTMSYISRETTISNRKIAEAKSEIKWIFKRHYSKYDRNWRDKPNQLKVPYVDKIRIEKRKIGSINRGAVKVGILLNAVQSKIATNKQKYDSDQAEKAFARLEKRKPQLERLAVKKRRAIASFITKFHKARQTASAQKSAKEQIPRSRYYRTANAWPRQGKSAPNSHYHRYNDPYRRRHHDNSEAYPCYYYPCDTCGEQLVGDNQDTDDQEMSILPPLLYCETSPESTLQSLEERMNEGINSPNFLSEMHMLAAEHGTDTLSTLSTSMDACSNVLHSFQELASVVGATLDLVFSFVSSLDLPEASYDEIVAGLPDIESDAIEEADEAVDMYAGAGPHRMGGDRSGDGSCDPLKAGARRRTKIRKLDRIQKRRFRQANSLECYRFLCLLDSHQQRQTLNRDWPHRVDHLWRNEATSVQIEALARSGLLGLPVASEFKPTKLYSWTRSKTETSNSHEVCLVTQCSLDRLSNLQKQVKLWHGKVSVALFLKMGESIEEARAALQPIRASKVACVSVSVVEATSEADAYPINFLRNVALLQAREEFLRAGSQPENTAVFLVDVDFVPSLNLHDVLHSKDAQSVILDNRRVIVIPAFEDMSVEKEPPIDCRELKVRINDGKAEPFHVAHFRQGHGPTRFDHYWKLSEGVDVNPWSCAYFVQYERLYEPYVVMAAFDAPLYDERFQGYGLNKISHLASVAHRSKYDLVVLPGVFVVAPYHERSEAYFDIYGNASAENDFAKLHLKALYHRFVEGEYDPIVSRNTKSWGNYLQSTSSVGVRVVGVSMSIAPSVAAQTIN